MDFEIRKVRTVQGAKKLSREREACSQLMRQGPSNKGACRIVGINEKTGRQPDLPEHGVVRHHRQACNDATLTYVRSFTKTLRNAIYRSGLYGFSSSSAKAIATAPNKTDPPGNLWYALWNKKNTTTTDWPWNPAQYTNHSRGHQYMVNSRETRGVYTITVDRNAWDAPVAIIG